MNTIEICSNQEWLLQSIDVDEEFTEAYPLEDIASRYFGYLCDAAEDAGFEVVRAKGNRSTFHGWNGAQFLYQIGPLGTFDNLTDSEKERFFSFIDGAKDRLKLSCESIKMNRKR